MKIYVCIKQVPNTNDVKIDIEKGVLDRKSAESIINPADKNALEEALKLKEINNDVVVTIISMGPPQAKEAILEALAMGADNAVLLTDNAFAGSDTYVTSYILKEAIKTLGMPDLILTGKQAMDGATAQVGPQLAEKLEIVFETSVSDLKLEGEHIIVNKETDENRILLKLKMPCLLAIEKDANAPRDMNIYDIIKPKEIKILSHEDINIDINNCGINASPTKVIETFLPPKDKECIFLNEKPIEELVSIIKMV